jgi:uncharacterized membrane protein YdbT with pleckstrin-like domain
LDDQAIYKMASWYFGIRLAWGLFWSLLIVGMPYTIGLLVRYYTTTVSVGQTGLVYKTGLIRKVEKQIPFSRVNSVDIQRNLAGQYFHYGDVRVLAGNDLDGIVFRGIDNPQALKEVIQSRIA